LSTTPRDMATRHLSRGVRRCIAHGNHETSLST
jgi:hypothetical protein